MKLMTTVTWTVWPALTATGGGSVPSPSSVLEVNSKAVAENVVEQVLAEIVVGATAVPGA
jgi:hypothetical protein